MSINSAGIQKDRQKRQQRNSKHNILFFLCKSAIQARCQIAHCDGRTDTLLALYSTRFSVRNCISSLKAIMLRKALKKSIFLAARPQRGGGG